MPSFGDGNLSALSTQHCGGMAEIFIFFSEGEQTVLFDSFLLAKMLALQSGGAITEGWGQPRTAGDGSSCAHLWLTAPARSCLFLEEGDSFQEMPAAFLKLGPSFLPAPEDWRCGGNRERRSHLGSCSSNSLWWHTKM